jgi:hypothetical protein
MLTTFASIVHDCQRAHGDERDCKQEKHCGILHCHLATRRTPPAEFSWVQNEPEVNASSFG